MYGIKLMADFARLIRMAEFCTSPGEHMNTKNCEAEHNDLRIRFPMSHHLQDSMINGIR